MTISEATERLIAAGTDDEKITLATVDLAIAGFPENQQPLLREAVFAASVPHWFDSNILSYLLNSPLDEINPLFEKLKGFSFVERHIPRNAWNIHERSRDCLLLFLTREEESKYVQLSAAAANVFSADKTPHSQIEAIYHFLIADPTRAAAELTDLFNDWMAHGRKENLQALAAALEEHIEHSRLKPRSLADALHITAVVQRNYRSRADTEERLKKALDIYREVGNRHEESVVLDCIADIVFARGDYDKALELRNSCLAISQKMLAEDPENCEERDLVVGYGKLGEIQRLKGDWDKALTSLNKAFELAKKLADTDPTDIQLQRDLSLVHTKTGDLLCDKKNFGKALKSFEAARVIRAELVAADPDNSLYQEDLYLDQSRLGKVYLEDGQFGKALDSFNSALILAEKFTVRSPENEYWQRKAAIARHGIGVAWLKQNKLQEALACFKAALVIFEGLAAIDPRNEDRQTDLQAARMRVAMAAAALKPRKKPSRKRPAASKKRR